jgi:hypothetical protein
MIDPVRVLPVVALGLLWLGCSAPPEKVDVQQTYPELGTRAALKPPLPPESAEMGQLIVFSLIQREPRTDITDINDYPPLSSVRTGYTVYDKNGIVMVEVPNYVPSIDSGPTKTSLPPGKYLIRLDQPQEGPNYFWVTIKNGELTRIDEKDLSKQQVVPTVK